MSTKKLVPLFTIATLIITMCLIILIPSSQARPIVVNPVISSQEAIAIADNHNEGFCEGKDKEDCLIRRTLEAHLDYIYTGDEAKHP